KRAGNDFGRRRGVRVGEDDERGGWNDRRAIRAEVRRIGPAANAEDPLAGLQEHLRDVEALVENSAGVLAKIENDSRRAFGSELLDRRLRLFGGVLVENL